MTKHLNVLLVVFSLGCHNDPGMLSPTSVPSASSLSTSSRTGGEAGPLVGALSHEKLLARDDSFRVASSTTLRVPAPGVLRNDTWPEGTRPVFQFVPETLPPADQVGVDLDGGFFLVLEEAPEPGKLSFDYVLVTPHGTSNVATIKLRITP